MSTERDILTKYTTIAVVGLDSDPNRPSHWVSEYMLENGYRIIPVNPAETEVFGVKAYPDLVSVPEQVDFVDVFRRPQFCPDVVRDAIKAGAKAVWLQSGIISEEARQLAEEAGITFVQDRCVMVEHRKYGIGRVNA